MERCTPVHQPRWKRPWRWRLGTFEVAVLGVEVGGDFEGGLPYAVGGHDVVQVEDGDDLVGALRGRGDLRSGGVGRVPEVVDEVEGVLVVDVEVDEDPVDQVEGGLLDGLCEGFARGHVDGDDDGGDLAVAGGLAQGASDGLDDVDGAGLGMGEEQGVDGGDVDAFGAAAAVGEDCPAGRLL